MTTTLTPSDRAALAKATKDRKQAEHDAGEFPRRAFVRVARGGKQFAGKIGQVHSHNDLRDDRLPEIAVEIGVVFTGGGGQTPVWFTADELVRCAPPANW